MSVVELFNIDVAAFPPIRGTRDDISTYHSLLEATAARGERWSSLPISRADLIDALKAIDKKIGGTNFLPVLALNNSPGNALGNRPQSPPFGYFSPEQVQDLNKCFGALTPDAIFELEQQGPIVADALYAFQSAAEAAAELGRALVVVHDRQ